MTDQPLTPAEDDIALAGELALRTLSPEEEAAALRRQASDSAFAREVERWNEHLARFVAEVAQVEPSAALWSRIEAQLAAGSGSSGAANDNAPLTFWRRWAIGSTGLLAASLAAIAVLVSQPAPVPPEPQPTVMRVATLTLENGAAAVTLAYDASTGNLYLAPTDVMEGDVRVPHLWLVLPDGNVQLVGAINPTEPATHNLPEQLAGLAGQAAALAVSMEQPGHTPGAHQPDGPVVAQGAVTSL
ncbi:MAG: anti-sigma factor domain-containing protein [Brevundimonas sp.]|jgi:anti-sigma-K factor RskA|uniref:anti-sigma factor n=1 Tax=Brevundimonas sp. TaxID=1871086 RepID=UPI00391AD3BC